MVTSIYGRAMLDFGADRHLFSSPQNNEIHVGGKSFPIKQHGFARDSEFEVVGNGCMGMKESTFGANYPYRLALEVCYRLEGSTVKAV